jgi:uncharacterized protein
MHGVDFSNLTEFEWDKGNKGKNEVKHAVTNKESEEVFFNQPLIVEDEHHSQVEQRYAAFGQTESGRLLAISFTVRNNKIRVISARDQSKKERKAYEQTKNT